MTMLTSTIPYLYPPCSNLLRTRSSTSSCPRRKKSRRGTWSHEDDNGGDECIVPNESSHLHCLTSVSIAQHLMEDILYLFGVSCIIVRLTPSLTSTLSTNPSSPPFARHQQHSDEPKHVDRGGRCHSRLILRFALKPFLLTCISHRRRNWKRLMHRRENGSA